MTRAEPGLISVIVPACNEEAWIGGCLRSLAAQRLEDGFALEIIVAANACRDATVAVARGFAATVAARGWRLEVLDLAEGGKTNAMNVADAQANGAVRVFMDADIVADPALMRLLHAALDRPEAAYASGRLTIPTPRSWWSRAYARVWSRLPFMTRGVPGAGVFAVNAAGRARWETFPKTFADDLWVRLLFRPEERHLADAPYLWPVAEGFGTLVRNRRRQNQHVRDILARYPELERNEDKGRVGPGLLLGLTLRMPLSVAAYALILWLSRRPATGATGEFRARETRSLAPPGSRRT